MSGAVVSLRPISESNREAVEALRLSPGQEQFVSTVADSLLEAAEEPDGRALYWAAGIIGSQLQPTGYRRDIAQIGAPRFTADPGKPLQDGAIIMRVPVIQNGLEPYMTVQGVTASAVVIDGSEVRGLPDDALIPLDQVLTMQARCKGIWEEALSQFEDQLPPAVAE